MFRTKAAEPRPVIPAKAGIPLLLRVLASLREKKKGFGTRRRKDAKARFARLVIPSKAGIFRPFGRGKGIEIPAFAGMTEGGWIPACAGMTEGGWICALAGMTEEGWIPACAGMTKEGWIPLGMHAMPPAWLRLSGGQPHLPNFAGMIE